MAILMSGVDRATRKFWKYRGRQLDLAGADNWLSTVRSSSSEVGDDWLATAAQEAGGSLLSNHPEAGLLDDMSLLNGPSFRVEDLRPEIRDFYEHTSIWRLEVWTQWSRFFSPGGNLLNKYFGYRVKQLAIPTRPLEVALGMDSEIIVITNSEGEQSSAAWVRRIRSTGEYIYSGCYRVQSLPGTEQPSVNVAFPLESGNLQVFLRPRNGRDGEFLMDSRPGSYGQNGTYVLVQEPDGRAYAARVPFHERFRVYVDDEGVLRTDHAIDLGRVNAVRLHYKMVRQPSTTP